MTAMWHHSKAQNLHPKITTGNQSPLLLQTIDRLMPIVAYKRRYWSHFAKIVQRGIYPPKASKPIIWNLDLQIQPYKCFDPFKMPPKHNDTSIFTKWSRLRLTFIPSISSVTKIWHPRRDLPSDWFEMKTGNVRRPTKHTTDNLAILCSRFSDFKG